MKSQFLLLTTSYSRERLWNFQFNKIRKTYQLTYYFTRKITNFFREIISKGRVFTNFNELRNPQFFMWIWSCQQKNFDFANSNFSLLKPLISRVSRIFWIRNPDELLTFIWISFFFFRRLKIHPDKTEVISWEKTMVEVEISCSNGWTAVPYCDNRLILQKSLLQKRN